MSAEDRETDRRARLLAPRELVRPLVVEAGAGTGKTATLVARVLAWSLGRGWTRAAERIRQRPVAPSLAGRGEDERIAAAVLNGVVAITFTEAAAAEMADRVSAGLVRVRDGGGPAGFEPPEEIGPAELRQRAALLSGAVDQLQVRTIHAFCRKLLAEHPFEAGVHPNFTVDAEGAMLREVVEETVEAALLEGYGDPGNPDYLALASRGQGPLELTDVLCQLAATGLGPEALADDPLAAERIVELGDRLGKLTGQLLTLLEVRRIAGTRAQNACAILEGLSTLRRKLRRLRSSPSPIADLQGWLDACLPVVLTDHLKLWARGETANRTEKERLASALPKLARLSRELHRLREHIGSLDPDLLGSARRVVAPLLDRVRGEMRARGALGFADLLRGARRLLRDHPSLLAQIRRRIDQLLVDEFQDTDHQQCDLIRRLALSGPREERPGLFVVGDPKQSIYGWRNAELRAYEEFVAAVEAEGGKRLALVENFRSVPAILAEVERVTAPVMRRQPGLQPEYQSLIACEHLREATGWDREAQAPVEHWISWCAGDARQPTEGNAQDTSALEARALVADLITIHRAGAAWKDVGLLLRSLTDLDTYLAALREARIPFVVSRDRQYYRRREIIDAAALVRTVLAPEDHLALLTFLRSVAVGVPDVALIPLWARQLPRRFSELVGPDREALDKIRRLANEVAGSLPSEIPGLRRVRGWEHNLAYAAECVAELRRSFEEEPADVFVERLRRLPLFEACEAARYLGAFRLANLERFFGQLLVALEQEAGDRHRVLRRLRTRIAEGYEAEEARPPEAGEDAVQVMTIHKAKGLEFEHVYLLQMHKEAGQRSAPSMEIGEWESRFEYQLFGAPTPGFDRLTARRDDVARTELVRTLYVAMTRAVRRLVLVGRRPLDGVAEALDRAGTHMALVLHRRGPQPSPAELVELWQSGEARCRRDGILWFLPGLEEGDSAPVEAGAEPILPSPSEVAAVRDQLRVDRRAAAARMDRPFRLAASKLGAPRAGDDLAEIRADRRLAELIPSSPESAPDRRRALVAGSAIHRVMETFDLTANPAVELERQRELLPGYLRMFGSAAEAAAAYSRARHLFDRLAGGQLLRRFLEIRNGIVARELPVLLPPVGSEDDPVGFLTGIIDLVYRDPANAELVVADFKTDVVASGEVASHAARYATQLANYVRALREALDLASSPRYELWYIDADWIVVSELA